jgi:hypothetical protein
VSDCIIARGRDKAEQAQLFDGVVIGVLVRLDRDNHPLVVFPGSPQSDCIVAKTTLSFTNGDLGKEVALLFENGDPQCPIIIGRLQYPRPIGDKPQTIHAELDGEKLVLCADREIVLKCGKSSITLTGAGKIILRGASIFSRSSGLNRIKGGSVQIN